MTRRIAISVALAGAGLLTVPVFAQETNACLPLPATKLEGFETNVDTVIIRATAPIGSVQAHAGTVAVRCREITDAGTGRRGSGLVVDIGGAGPVEDSVLIDYDELDSLLDGLDYIAKLDWTVTPLPSFSAVYATKGGFRAAAFGSRRTGNIEFSVRSMRVLRAPLLLSRDQMGQLRSLIEQGKAKLDSLRSGK